MNDNTAARYLALALTSAAQGLFEDAGVYLCKAAKEPDALFVVTALVSMSAGPGVGQEQAVAAPDYSETEVTDQPIPEISDTFKPRNNGGAALDTADTTALIRPIEFEDDEVPVGEDCLVPENFPDFELHCVSSAVSLKKSYAIRETPVGYVRGASAVVSSMRSLSAEAETDLEADEEDDADKDELDVTSLHEDNGDEDDIEFDEDDIQPDPDLPGEQLIPAAFTSAAKT